VGEGTAWGEADNDEPRLKPDSEPHRRRKDRHVVAIYASDPELRNSGQDLQRVVDQLTEQGVGQVLTTLINPGAEEAGLDQPIPAVGESDRFNRGGSNLRVNRAGAGELPHLGDGSRNARIPAGDLFNGPMPHHNKVLTRQRPGNRCTGSRGEGDLRARAPTIRA